MMASGRSKDLSSAFVRAGGMGKLPEAEGGRRRVWSVPPQAEGLFFWLRVGIARIIGRCRGSRYSHLQILASNLADRFWPRADMSVRRRCGHLGAPRPGVPLTPGGRRTPYGFLDGKFRLTRNDSPWPPSLIKGR